MNRYSFVFKDNDRESVPTLIRNLCGQLGPKVFIVFSWLIELPGKSLVASRMIESRYRKKGWNIHLRDNHYLGVKELPDYDVKTWPPLDGLPLGGGGIVLVGCHDEKELLTKLKSNISAFLAHNGYFVPDRNLLDSVAGDQLKILYQVNDELGNIGFVVAVPERIRMEVGKDLEVIETFADESAYRIFV